MRITPVTMKTITFGEGNMNNITPHVGLLSIQNSDKLKFEKNLKLTQEADAVQSNPIAALGHKFAKAYKILFSEPNTEYKHLPYMA